jgi:uncharacterized protein YecE (DUF72 family)
MHWIGTSGYNYPEWKGSFYPNTLAAARMLPFYAERFPAVEINYTFYRLPTRSVIEGWSAVTPPTFHFALKAPRRITHIARLRECDALLASFFSALPSLGPKLGPVLFQLGPTHKADLPVLDAFLHLLPPRVRAAFEFRHPSWFEPSVLDRLRDRNLALCVADGGTVDSPVEVTADYAYFRLRDEGYDTADLQRWARVVAERTSACRDVYVFFKHEESGKGPELAAAFREALLGAGVAAPGSTSG